MAAIMQEWQTIIAQAQKLAKKAGVQVPPELLKMEGDIWVRQAGRLRALGGFLREVNRSMPDTPPADEPAVEPPPEAVEAPAVEPPAEVVKIPSRKGAKGNKA